MRISVENLLLLLLPFLLLAIMAFAKSRPADYELLAVGDGGSELIYRKHATLLSPSLLLRDRDGVRTSVELGRGKGMQPYVVMVATKNRIVAYDGDEFTFFDTDLAKVGASQVYPWNGICTRVVVSANQRFLFCNSQGGDRDNYFRSCIIDLNNGEVTWKSEPFAVGESKRYFDKVDSQTTGLLTNAVENTLVESLPDSSTGKLVPGATYSFETGAPTKIRSESAIPYLSADAKRSIVQVPGVGFKLINEGRDVILNAKIPPDNLEVVFQTEHRILFEHNQVFKLFDWRSMQFENRISRVGNFGAPSPVLSPDGNTMALQVTHWNCSWADYLRSGCGTHRTQLGIYDAKTGDRIRVVEDSWPFWTLVVLAIGGSVVWSIAWVWTRSRRRDAHRAISDVLVLLLLWFSIALLRFVFGGWLPDSMMSFYSDRPADVALTCVLGCLMAMVAIWATFARLRWSFRLPVAVIGVAILWAVQMFLWNCFELELGAMRLTCLFVLIGVSFICVITRMFGWRLRPTEVTAFDAQKRSTQIPLIDLFLFPLAIGLCFAVFGPILLGISVAIWIGFAIRSLPIALTIILALWAAFSVYEKPKWILGSIFLVCLIACVSRFLFWNQGAYYAISGSNTMSVRDGMSLIATHHVATASGAGACSLLAMCFVSRLGWKWQQKQRVLESAL